MTSTYLRRAAVTLACLPLLAATPALASGPAPTRAEAVFEVDFLQDMIDHHAMAVMMAQMCIQKATHDELRTLCESIVAAQTAEIQLMQSWLQEWYGISYTPDMKKSAEKRMQRMMQLSGADFEIAFMDMMIRHHWKAVIEGRMCIDRAYHPELVALCQNIVETQSAEIIEMQTWLCEWHGICRSGPRPDAVQ
jgi:uncharacterized protein (DUF305 family)